MRVGLGLVEGRLAQVDETLPGMALRGCLPLAFRPAVPRVMEFRLLMPRTLVFRLLEFRRSVPRFLVFRLWVSRVRVFRLLVSRALAFRRPVPCAMGFRPQVPRPPVLRTLALASSSAGLARVSWGGLVLAGGRLFGLALWVRPDSLSGQSFGLVSCVWVESVSMWSFGKVRGAGARLRWYVGCGSPDWILACACRTMLRARDGTMAGV